MPTADGEPRAAAAVENEPETAGDSAAPEQPAGPKKIAVIVAHPDDAEFICAGTVAKWANEGHEITYVLLTSGDKGSDDLTMTAQRLVATREAEQRAAGDVLGVRDIVFLRYPDAMLVPDLELRRTLTRVIRQLKPDIVVCQDPTARWSGQEYIQHPDHIAAGEATLAALFPAARDRLTFPELLAEGLEPHKVREVYLCGAKEPDVWVDITETIEQKLAALGAHKSQMGDWDFAPMIREWAKGTAAGHEGSGEYAESFKYFKLD